MVIRPEADEYFHYYHGYVSKAEGNDLLKSLRHRRDFVEELYSAISEEQSLHRYAADKWSIRELLGHLIDTERIMAFRALSFARGNAEPVPGMDQDEFMSNSGYNECRFEDLVEEFLSVRDSHILMFSNFPAKAWTRRGVASGYEFSVRALGYIIAGHEIHHTNILVERYLKR